MIVLGLTGSIGMGKSMAAKNFRRLGIPVHDADGIVHELLSEGGEAVEKIKKLFPAAVKKKSVDRKKIADEIFANPESLARIERVLHPMVRARAKKFLQQAAHQGRHLVVLDVPLLFETGGEARCDAVVVVSAPLFLQEQRVLKRPGMTRKKFNSILARQMPDAEKCRRASFIVLTGLGRDFGLLQIQNIVRITNGWRETKWPPGLNLGA